MSDDLNPDGTVIAYDGPAYKRVALPADPWGSAKAVACVRCGCIVAFPSPHGDVCPGRN